jgi:hypothetical protein
LNCLNEEGKGRI